MWLLPGAIIDFFKHAGYFKQVQEAYPTYRNSFRQVLYPNALNDAGSGCASMFNSVNGNQSTDLEPLTNW
jgi:hypothetical protein